MSEKKQKQKRSVGRLYKKSAPLRRQEIRHPRKTSDTSRSSIHTVTAAEAMSILHSYPLGLGSAEAARRLVEFGNNTIEHIQREPLVWRFLKEFTHLFAIVLWVASGLCFYAEWQSPGEGMITLGMAIIGVIIINGIFSFWQEYQAEQAITALERLLPHEVSVFRDGVMVQESIANLVPGDVILLQEGDNIPADCRVLEGNGLRVNNATVTGESHPVSRNAEPSNSSSVLQAENMALAGTSVVSGRAKALVVACGARTEFGKIARLTQHSEEGVSPLQKEIQRVTRFVALFASGLGIIFFVIGQFVGLPFWANFIFAIGIIVANVPEGLLPTVTLALAMGAQRMAKRHALIRHLPAVEALGCATVVCSDKTGTLTEGRMSVRELYLGDALLSISPDISPSLTEHYREFFFCALLCHSLKPPVALQRGSHLPTDEMTVGMGDPMEQALVRMAYHVLQPTVFPLPDPYRTPLYELAFDAERKRMSVVHLMGSPTNPVRIIYTKGAPEKILELCTMVHSNGGALPMNPEHKSAIIRAQTDMASRGLRVLALAYRIVASDTSTQEHLEQSLVFAGLTGLEDPPRAAVPDAVQQCHTAGIRIIMVTGDHPATALAIAREIGIIRGDNPTVITGEEVSRLSATELQVTLGAPELVFARMAADQKMRVVEALQHKGEIVAVTGDGVNDAPALKRADIGIAMGMSGTDVAREAADMVLLDDNFATIVAAIEEGRGIFANIRKFLTYILSSNIPEIVPYLAFVLLKIPLPLTIIQILAVDLGTDMLPALALGKEPPDHDVMRKPPRKRDEHLLNSSLLWRSYGFLGVIEAIAAMAGFFFVLRGAWNYGDTLNIHNPLYLQATTACLTTIIMMQVVNVFLCRSESDSLFTTHWRELFTNRLLWIGVAVELILILLIDYTSWGNIIFGTAPIILNVWIFCLPCMLTLITAEELRKWFIRTRLRKKS